MIISDITLGQFFPGNSIIHKLDPRIKIILTIFFIVAIFVSANPITFLFLFFFTFSMVAASGISFKVIAKSIKPLIFILIFTSLINVFMTKGAGEPLVSWKFINIYEEGVVRAVFMALRVCLLIVGTCILLTYTTSPIALTDGIESLLSPLKFIGIPVHSFAMMMSIALRFIPTLIEETEKIMNAQKSRGADFSSGGLIRRAKALIPLLVPLFVSAFKRADELATAMECRCYRGDKKRTKLVKLQMHFRDYSAIVLFAVVLAMVICATILPYKMTVESGFFDIAFYKI